jgi:hypothetical protein
MMNVIQSVHRICVAARKTRLCLAEKHRVRDLPEWLEIATKNLAVPAKERILAEIDEHYTETVTSHLAEGMSESDAKVNALAELGDARKAAKRFRTIHMTKFDSTQVKIRVNLAKSRLVMVSGYFVWLMWFLMYLGGVLDGPLKTVNLIFGFFLLVIYPTARFITVQRKSIRFLYIIDIIALIFAWSISIYAANMSGGFSSDFRRLLPFAVWGVLWIFMIFNPLRTWLKLRHIPNIHDEVPLQNE